MSDPHAKPHHHVAETAPLHDPVDQWHDHSHDEKPQHAHGEVQNSNLIMFVGLALTAVIVASSLVVYGFYIHYNTQRSNERENTSRDRLPSDIAPSPTELTRAKMGSDMLLLSKGGTTQMPTEVENVNRTVNVSKIGDVIDGVVQSYTSGRPAK